MPDPRDHLDDDYTYVRAHVRRRARKSPNKRTDEGCGWLGLGGFLLGVVLLVTVLFRLVTPLQLAAAVVLLPFLYFVVYPLFRARSRHDNVDKDDND